MTTHGRPEYQPRRYRPRRARSRDMDWWGDRELAQTVQCPPRPRGCGAPIGETCRNRHGEELVNQPAHDARLRRAAQPEPDPAGDPDPDSEET